MFLKKYIWLSAATLLPFADFLDTLDIGRVDLPGSIGIQTTVIRMIVD